MKKRVYSYICGRIASAESDVTPRLSPPHHNPPPPFFLLFLWECRRFVSPKGRWQASEGEETPSMKPQIACVGKSDSEANAKRKLLPHTTAHC